MVYFFLGYAFMRSRSEDETPHPQVQVALSGAHSRSAIVVESNPITHLQTTVQAYHQTPEACRIDMMELIHLAEAWQYSRQAPRILHPNNQALRYLAGLVPPVLLSLTLSYLLFPLCV